MKPALNRLLSFSVIFFSALILVNVSVFAQENNSDSESVLGPGDSIEIRVPAEPDLSGEYVIDERGSFEFPMILGLDLGSFSVEGKTVTETKSMIQERMSQYYSMTDVSVTLKSLGTRPNRSISVFGYVARPGNYQFYESMTFLDLLSRTGHLLEDADPSRVTLYRPGNERLVLDIRGILSGENLDSNIKLQAGDYVIVPPIHPMTKMKIVVLGKVRQPGTYYINDGARLLEALSAAEGTDGRAAVNKTHIIRAENGKPVLIPIDIKALLDQGDIRYNVELKDGDVIFIPETGRVDIMKVVGDIIDLNLLRNIVKDEF